LVGLCLACFNLFLRGFMLHHDKDARAILSELAEGRPTEAYIDLIWAQRYPQPMPASSGGWPYKSQAGVVQTSKLRKVK
jgi:hypothetical protein